MEPQDLSANVLLTGIGVAKQAEDKVKPIHGCKTEINWSLGGSVDWWIKCTIPGIDALPDAVICCWCYGDPGDIIAMTNLHGRKLSPRRAICMDYTKDVCELAAINEIEISGTKVYVPASQKYAVPSITTQPTIEKCRWPQSEGCNWYENCLDRFNDCKNSCDE